MNLRTTFLLMLSSLTALAAAPSTASGDILSAVPPEDFRVIGDLNAGLTQSGIEDAKKSLIQGDFRGAREKLQKVNETNKDLPLPELIISGWLFELNYPVMATQVLQQIGFTHGKRQDVQIQLAQVAMTQARFYEASLLIESALQSPPEPEWSEQFKSALVAQIRETQGAIEERRNRMPEAKEIYTKLLAENSNSLKALLGLARSTFALGEVDQCEGHFRKLEELSPEKAPVTEVAVATLYLAKNDAANAEIWLKKGLERTGTQNSIARLEYARFLLKANRPEDAKTVLAQAKPIDALKSEFAFHIAQSEQMLGNFDKSVSILAKIWKAAPNNFVVGNHLAWAMLQSSDPKTLAQGARLAQQNLQNNPASVEAIATSAWAQFKRGDQKGADEIVSRPLPNRNFSRDAAYFLSEILEASGKSSEAAGIRARVISASGEFYHARVADLTAAGTETQSSSPAPSGAGATGTASEPASSPAATGPAAVTLPAQ